MVVYIEDRIGKLEEGFASLKEKLQEVQQQVNEKKRKQTDTVDREELRAALAQKADKAITDKLEVSLADMHAAVAKQLKDVVRMDVLEKSLREVKDSVQNHAENSKRSKAAEANSAELQNEVAQLRQACQAMVSEQKLVQALHEVQNNTSKALVDLQEKLQYKVSQEELATNVQQVHAALQQSQQQGWKDIDPQTDTGFFDVSRSYRIRIGDGQAARWLYSTEVSAGQIYLVDTILDQGMVVNSTSKGSYGARRLGADITTTKYFAVFQMQSRTA
mmetsp:Transcript_791/g.1704  ORF Transcript_791/g.1704 Transcript_791/m.1704 type:complete len:275 (-) Transcript_791:121-945(-)